MKKQTRLFTAAMAAVMAVSALPIAGSAELLAVPESTSVVSSKYEDEWGYKTSEDGFIYLSSDDNTTCELIDYEGTAEDLVIPETIDGLTVTGIASVRNTDENFGFQKLDSIKSLTIIPSLTCLPDVFENCKNLEKVTLPDSITQIADYAFFGCSSLTEVKLPENLKYIGEGTFCCTPWLEKLKKTEKLVIFGTTLYYGQYAEGDVVIPDYVTGIFNDAFNNNKTMTSLTVPGSVQGIGKHIVAGADNLKKITLKNGVRGLGSECFVGAPNLEKIILPPSIEEIKNILIRKGNKNKTTIYYYKSTYVAEYLNKNMKGYKLSVLPSKTKSFTATAKTRSIEMKWKKVSTATGYQIKVATDKNFKKIIKTRWIDKGSPQPLFCRVRNLKKGQKYYVKMRTYRTIAGKKYYGNYTKIRTVIVK